MKGGVFRGALLLPVLLLSTCTNAGLHFFGDTVSYVDDQLAVSGGFCSSTPDEVVFPVKMLIVMDQSASLQCTDPGNIRLEALAAAGAALDPLPNVEFAVVGFAAWSRTTDFTPDWGVASGVLAPENGQGGPATDYQGALATALTVLEQDMLSSGPAEVARTKYVVLFMSDGVPEPRCLAGCDDDDGGVCNTDRPIADEDYVDMAGPCPEYNQEHQLRAKVQDIMGLAEFHGAGSLSFNTVLLFADEDQIALACEDPLSFGYDRADALPLLQALAEEGEGTFRDLNTSAELEFLDYDFESLQAPYEVAEFFAMNVNAVPDETGMVPDSDADGIPDATEFDDRFNRLQADSDGDGFGDLFEQRFASNGFDALVYEIPAAGCTEPDDRDQDGLRACEEAFLDTDPSLPDTDGDRIPDGLELRLGLDPTVDDTMVDHDMDGRLSGAEIRTGTHPMLHDEEDALLHQIRYSVDADPEAQLDGSRCYDYSFQGITLVPTLATNGDKGRNRVYIFAEEEPAGLAGSRGRFHVACVEARYMGPSFKSPENGLIEDLNDRRFVELQEFDPELHCLPVGGDPAGFPPWAEL